MSYHTWHDYGYGIRLSDILPLSPARLRSFICRRHPIMLDLQKWLGDEKRIKDMTYDDFEDYGNDLNCAGIASILQEVIKQETGIELYSCTDFEGDCYLLYLPVYPWNMQEQDENITPDHIERILLKYTDELSDDPVTVDYQEVANGG